MTFIFKSKINISFKYVSYYTDNFVTLVIIIAFWDSFLSKSSYLYRLTKYLYLQKRRIS